VSQIYTYQISSEFYTDSSSQKMYVCLILHHYDQSVMWIEGTFVVQRKWMCITMLQPLPMVTSNLHTLLPGAVDVRKLMDAGFYTVEAVARQSLTPIVLIDNAFPMTLPHSRLRGGG